MAAAEGSGTGGGLSQYEVLGTIGQGSFGTVQKVKRKADGRVSFMHVSVVTLVSLHSSLSGSCVQVHELW